MSKVKPSTAPAPLALLYLGSARAIRLEAVAEGGDPRRRGASPYRPSRSGQPPPEASR